MPLEAFVLNTAAQKNLCIALYIYIHTHTHTHTHTHHTRPPIFFGEQNFHCEGVCKVYI